MSKRFSIVDVENKEIFLKGWVNPEDLSDSKVFLSVMSEISSYSSVKIVINHCLLLDYPGVTEDITSEELDDLLEVFDELVENNHIYLEENIIFNMQGLDEEQIIEESV